MTKMALNLNLTQCALLSRENRNERLEKSLTTFASEERRRLTDAMDGFNPESRRRQSSGGQGPSHQEILDYLSVIRRGQDLSPYFKTSDDRIIQHNIKGGKAIYDVRYSLEKL